MIWSYFNDTEENNKLLPRYYPNHLTQSYSQLNNDDHLHSLSGDEQEERFDGEGINRSVKKILFKRIQKMRIFFTLLFLLLIYVAAVISKPLFSTFKFKHINTIVSFGDSYTTRYLNMNNLNYACRNCTSAGGPNWVIYLTDSTNWISWDFAYNSAPVNNTIVKQVPTVIDVSTQIRDLFNKVFVTPTKEISAIVASVYKGLKRTSQSTLTTVWVGINDIDLTYNWKDTNALDLLIMHKYEILLNELVEKGETQFMLINIPPIDRAPLWHKTEHEHIIKNRVIGYNSKLKDLVNGFKKSHPGITMFEYDAWGYFNKMLDHPTDYNIKDTHTFCSDWSHPKERNCKPIHDYFWLNDLHPTYHVHKHLAKDIEHFLRNQ